MTLWNALWLLSDNYYGNFISWDRQNIQTLTLTQTKLYWLSIWDGEKLRSIWLLKKCFLTFIYWFSCKLDIMRQSEHPNPNPNPNQILLAQHIGGRKIWDQYEFHWNALWLLFISFYGNFIWWDSQNIQTLTLTQNKL